MAPLIGMMLRAISTGQGVPAGEDFDGRVHSVFISAANLSLPDAGLITLLTSDSPNLPRGVRLETPPGFSFEDCLEPGMIAACRAGLIRFSGSALTIDLGMASIWRCDLTALAVDLSRKSALDGWQIARAELAAYPGAREGIAGAAFDPGEAGSPLARAGREPIGALIDCARRLDPAGAAPAAAHLIGLGPGLTPSGDDFLTGFLAGLWACAAGDPRRKSFIEALGTGIAPLADRTTDVSRAYLLDAARGQVSETIVRLIEAIDDGSQPEIERAARSALGVGSTSGADGVAGVLCGLWVWKTTDGSSPNRAIRIML